MNKEITKSNKKQLNLLSFKMAQLNRQFDLMKLSVERCKRDYPNDFHHKEKMQSECKELVSRLENGRNVIKQMIKDQSLLEKQSRELKAFLQAVNYLKFKFSDVSDHVDEIRNREVNNG